MPESQKYRPLQARPPERPELVPAKEITLGAVPRQELRPIMSRAITNIYAASSRQKLVVSVLPKKTSRRKQHRTGVTVGASLPGLPNRALLPREGSLAPSSSSGSSRSEASDDTDATDIEDLTVTEETDSNRISGYASVFSAVDGPTVNQRRDMILSSRRASPQMAHGNTRADPFNCFAISLDELEKRLIDFHVHDYARVTFGIGSKLQAGVRCFYQIRTSQLELHAAISQAALEISHQNNSPFSAEHRYLQVAALHHKGEAIRAINKALQDAVITQHVISATISIARNELRHGSYEAAKLHFAAVRRMIQMFGGRPKITLPYLIVQTRGLECTFADPAISCFFDQSGLSERVQELQNFLDKIQSVGEDRLANMTRNVSPELENEPYWQVLKPGSLFHALLMQEVRDPRNVIDSNLNEVHSQTAILIGMSIQWLYTDDIRLMRDWVAWRNSVLVQLGVQKHDSPCNANNLISPAIDNKSLQAYAQVWSLIDMMNAVRYLSFPWKLKIRNWLLAWLEGRKPAPLGRLDAFALSYMTA